MSKLLKLLGMLSSRSIVTFVCQASNTVETQFNLIVRHQENASIEYTGLHWLFIKKPWLDVTNVQSYRPICGMSKLLEQKFVACHFNEYLQLSDLLPFLQSSFQPNNSTEKKPFSVSYPIS